MNRGRARLLSASLAGMLCVAAACTGPEEADLCLASVAVSSELLRPLRIVAALDGEGVRVKGMAGAALPAVTVHVDDEPTPVADDGSFEHLLSDVSGEVVVRAASADGEETLTYRPRSLSAALSCVAAEALPSGTLPNDVVVAPSCTGGESLAAFVTLTGDGSLDVVDLGDGTRPSTTPYFPPTDGTVAAEPFAAARTAAGDRAAVSLRGIGTVALVDPCAGTLVDEAAPQTSDSAWLIVDVDPPVALREPRDVDGDGLLDTDVARMRVSGPQALTFSGERLWVAYTNVLEPALDEANPMSAGPGALLVFEIDDDVLVPAGHRVLPAQNPQALVADGEGGVWVAATGAYAYEGATLVAGTAGALVQVTADLALARVIDAGRFAPGTPTLAGDRLVVGSTLQATIAVVDLDSADLDDATRLSLTGDERLNTVFDTVALPGGLVAALHFETDELHVVDPATATLHPWPFVEPIVLGDGGGAFRGAKAIDLDGWRGAALLALSAEVVPVDLRQVMGP